jgi:hypothetical protein
MVPEEVIGGVVMLNAGGIASCTLVTVPTDQLLFADRFCVTPLMLNVLVVGTGVYPNAVIMSPCVTGVAEVTRPLPFTATFKKVSPPYTSGLTVCNVRVVGEPVVPVPVTSPTMMMAPEGTAMFIGVTLVTSPFAFTVILGTCVVEPYVPGLALTLANVRTADPGPLAVPSPVSAVI